LVRRVFRGAFRQVVGEVIGEVVGEVIRGVFVVFSWCSPGAPPGVSRGLSPAWRGLCGGQRGGDGPVKAR